MDPQTTGRAATFSHSSKFLPHPGAQKIQKRSYLRRRTQPRGIQRMQQHWLRLPFRQQPHQPACLHVCPGHRMAQHPDPHSGDRQLVRDRRIGHGNARLHPHLLHVGPAPQPPHCIVHGFAMRSATRRDAAMPKQVCRHCDRQDSSGRNSL